MLGVERQHDFHKISDSAIYIHFKFEITSQNDLLDAPMALKTRPKRLKSASRAPPDALKDAFWPSLGSLGALLGAFGPFWSAQGLPGRTPAPLWELFVEGFGFTCFFSLLH